MKIAIVVRGRLHAFHLARALSAAGQDVTLFTNYPKFAVSRFGIPPSRVRSFAADGIVRRLPRVPASLSRYVSARFFDWLRKELPKERWDALYLFTDVAAPVLRTSSFGTALKLVVKGNAHFQIKNAWSRQEAARAQGLPLPALHSDAARQEEAHKLADAVIVLSTFAEKTFLDAGFPRERLRRLNLGVDLGRFRASEKIVEARAVRMASGEPLRVLTTGQFSLRKGAIDLVRMARLCGKNFRFRHVGIVLKDARALSREGRGLIEFVPKVPEFRLPRYYAWADLFVFPTIEDGFAVVLPQAQAAALPVLATAHSAAPDLIEEGKNGWVFPIREPERFTERLRWCDAHREELAEMTRDIRRRYVPRDWSDAAADLIGLIQELSKHNPHSVRS